MTPSNRPLSPHLLIYKWQITMVLSVFHRATGCALIAGIIMLAYWLGAAAYSPEAFARAQWFMGTWLGILMLLGWSACLFYHLCAGIRHLLWDAGWGFEIPQLYRSGYTMVATAGVLTLVTWIIGFARF